MDKETIHFIRNTLHKGRSVYHHFADSHAFLLLENYVGEQGQTIQNIKESPFGTLLNKPSIKKVLFRMKGERLTSWELMNSWPQSRDGYRLTLGTWPDLDRRPDPRWDQITRKGWNLVLQLNFPISHNRILRQSVEDWQEPLEYSLHPIHKGEEITLAWSRIDLDLETGEALIEEIQSDWIRDVRDYADDNWSESAKSWKKYYEEILLPKGKKWPEIMLTATLWFLVSEIGLRQIFYHTADTGVTMKRIHWKAPPRSLYTDLPKRFCFQKTHNGPLFIRDFKDRKLHSRFIDPKTTWYVLEFS